MYGVFFLLSNGLLGYVFVKKKNPYKIINQNGKEKVYTSCLSYATYVVGSSG